MRKVEGTGDAIPGFYELEVWECGASMHALRARLRGEISGAEGPGAKRPV